MSEPDLYALSDEKLAESHMGNSYMLTGDFYLFHSGTGKLALSIVGRRAE
jgi:hypothetical protein